MKKHSFWKSIGIIFAVIFVLSWLIPGGKIESGVFAKGTVSPFGLLDLVRIPVSIVSNYINYAIYVLAIGGFYGVLNYTGVYTPLVDKLVNKFKKNALPFLIGTVVMFAIISAGTALNYLLFIFVPFFVTVLIKLNYKKTTAIGATVGAFLVGNFASLYGFSINGYLNYYLELSVHQDIVIRILLLIVSISLLVAFLVWDSKKTKEEKVTDLPLYEKKDSKKKLLPLVFVVITMAVFIIIAGYNWRYMSNITFFDELFDNIAKIKIGDYQVVNNIIGNTNQLGWWGMSETVIVLILTTFLIGWVYGLKIKEIFESFIKGAKEMQKTALYVVAANIAVGMLAYAGYASSETIYITIVHSIVNMSNTFNALVVMLYALVSGFFYNDVSAIVAASMIDVTTTITTVKDYPVLAMIVQMFHAMLMMLLPTSLFLVGALAYLNVSYLDWLKYIWKFVLAIFALAIVTIIILLLI